MNPKRVQSHDRPEPAQRPDHRPARSGGDSITPGQPCRNGHPGTAALLWPECAELSATSGSVLPAESSWKPCAGWSTAGTTRRESRWSTVTANSPCVVVPAGWPTWTRPWPRWPDWELSGTTGLGHTRWATHGRPTDRNAHPHRDAAGKIAVVHNGIIENFAILRQELEAGRRRVRQRHRHRGRGAFGGPGIPPRCDGR